VTVRVAPEAGLFLGVDGGGTKTHFICIDNRGTVVAEAEAGTSYHLQAGLDGAVHVLRVGVAAICAALAIAPSSFAHAFFGLPAYGEDSRIDPRLHAACGEILGHGRYRCGNDMVCGWAGSFGCEDGINLVAGTGSIGYGERRGRAARIGGWGEVFSDEGSAYWIAVQGLNAFTRMSDGRLPRSELYGRLKEALRLAEDMDVCARIMGETGMVRGDIAALSRVVSQAARDGDAVAASILEQAASALAEMAIALRSRLGFETGEDARLSWSGGVLTGGAGVLPLLRARIDAVGGFCLVEPRYAPGYGAALYARYVHAGEQRSG